MSHPYKAGDSVSIYSAGEDTWYSDGIVIEVSATTKVIQEGDQSYEILPGSVQVDFTATQPGGPRKVTRWIKPADISNCLRPNTPAASTPVGEAPPAEAPPAEAPPAEAPPAEAPLAEAVPGWSSESTLSVTIDDYRRFDAASWGLASKYLLDPQQYKSVNDVIERLNADEVLHACANDGYCTVYSASRQRYYLLWRSDKTLSEASAALRLPGEACAQAASPRIIGTVDDAIELLGQHGAPPDCLTGLRRWRTGNSGADVHAIAMYTAQNPIDQPINNSPPEGKYFPLARGAKVKANWDKYFAVLGYLKLMMVSIGVRASNVGTSAAATPTPAEVVQDVINNLYTLVLSTVDVRGWSITWAMSVAMLIVTCYQDCSHLLLIALQGGPGCEEECNFLDILLRGLGFTPKGETDRSEALVKWTWYINRPNAMPFTIDLKKLAQPEVNAQNFQITEENRCSPNLFRAAIVSCMQGWGPQKAETLYVPEKNPQGMRRLEDLGNGSYKLVNEDPGAKMTTQNGLSYRTEMKWEARHPNGKGPVWDQVLEGDFENGWLKVVLDEKESRRQNDDGETPNDVLNNSIVDALTKLKDKYATRDGFPPVRLKSKDPAGYKAFWGPG